MNSDFVVLFGVFRARDSDLENVLFVVFKEKIQRKPSLNLLSCSCRDKANQSIFKVYKHISTYSNNII